MEGASGPVDLQIGPGGDWFYADLSPGTPGGGSIRRIRYQPDGSPNCGAATGSELVGVDIGNPAVAGSSDVVGGTWTVSGFGRRHLEHVGQFHFACQPLSGDGSITAEGDQPDQYHSAWAKAGVMMRASAAADAADAPHAMVVVTPRNGVAFQYRSSAGGSSTHRAGPAVGVPQWVRLTRSGDTLTGETSSDGTTWTEIGSATIDLGSDPRTGLAVTSPQRRHPVPRHVRQPHPVTVQ